MKFLLACSLIVLGSVGTSMAVMPFPADYQLAADSGCCCLNCDDCCGGVCACDCDMACSGGKCGDCCEDACERSCGKNASNGCPKGGKAAEKGGCCSK